MMPIHKRTKILECDTEFPIKCRLREQIYDLVQNLDGFKNS